MSLRARIALFYCLTISFIIFGLTFTAQRIMVSSLRTDLDYNLKLRASAISTLISSAPDLVTLRMPSLSSVLPRRNCPQSPSSSA